jgi:hypothetical protein
MNQLAPPKVLRRIDGSLIVGISSEYDYLFLALSEMV